MARFPWIFTRFLTSLSAVAVLLLPPAAALQANGHWCKACAVVVEETQAELWSQVKGMYKERADSELPLDVAATAARVCASAKLATHTKSIVDGCRQIAEGNPGALVEAFRGFNWRGREPDPSHVYRATEAACVKTLDLCAGTYCMVPPCGDWRPADRCDRCKAVVQDMRDTLLRRRPRRQDGGATTAGYLSRAHVDSVVQEACSVGLAMRHPSDLAPALQEVCEELLEDHDDAVARTFMDDHVHPIRFICGPSLSGMCGEDGLVVKPRGRRGDKKKNKKINKKTKEEAERLQEKRRVPQLNGDWDAWRGPWSHMSYIEAAEVLKSDRKRNEAMEKVEKKREKRANGKEGSKGGQETPTATPQQDVTTEATPRRPPARRRPQHMEEL
eukprot:g1833.t1